MPKSTAHRYLATLDPARVGGTTRCRSVPSGPKVIELAGSYLANTDLRNEAQSVLDALAAQTGETVHLAVPSGTEVVYISKVECNHALRMYSYIGAKLPMYCTALGKTILAFGPPELTREVLTRKLKARTPHTLTAPEALLAELETIRTQGYALDDEENELGIRCIGAPIFDYTRQAIAALSISGPNNRMSRERCVGAWRRWCVTDPPRFRGAWDQRDDDPKGSGLLAVHLESRRHSRQPTGELRR